MSLRIVPAASNPSQTALRPSAPSAPGVHDTLRANLSLNTPITTSSSTSSPASTAPVVVQSSHPLEARLAHWRATQDALKMTLLRRQFGIAEPVKRQMELKIAGEGEWRPRVLGARGPGVHEDVLAGRDGEVGWEDVYKGGEGGEGMDMHSEVEGRLGMGW